MADLNYVRWFTEIVEVGSSTRPAARLGLTKSAVSKGIAKLESRLGVPLLQRTTRQVTLIAAGRALYEGAADAIEKLERAELEVSQRSRKPGAASASRSPTPGVPHSGQYDPLRVDADLLIQTGPLVDSTAGFVKLGSVSQGVFAARKFSRERGPFERPEALQGLARSKPVRQARPDDVGVDATPGTRCEST